MFARHQVESHIMKKLNQKSILWSAVGAVAVSGLAAGIAFAGSGATETEVALPAATVTRAINAAVKAKAGNVAGVEMETEKGVTHVDVEIVANDGKKYEVGVNAQTGKVMAVEADNGKENEVGEANEKGEQNEQGEDD